MPSTLPRPRLAPIFYENLAARAALGRRDAAEHPELGGPPVLVYLRRDRHAAAVAFWRASGLSGHDNRHRRRREARR